ncbi:hypothetical protein WA158_001448 [Blastocystis sp. Blastoise]
MDSQIKIEYAKSRDIKLPFKLYISSLDLPVSGDSNNDFFVLAKLYNGNYPLHNSYVYSSLKRSRDDSIEGNKWMTFPVYFSDLRLNSRVILTVLDYSFTPIIISSYQIFDDDHTLRQGLHKIRFYRFNNKSEPELIPNDCGKSGFDEGVFLESVSDSKISLKNRNKWFDDMTSKQIDSIIFDQDSNEEYKHNLLQYTESKTDIPSLDSTYIPAGNSQFQMMDDRYIYMRVRFAIFNCTVVYNEERYPSNYIVRDIGEGWSELTEKMTELKRYININEHIISREYPKFTNEKTIFSSPSPQLTPQQSPNPAGIQTNISKENLTGKDNDPKFADWKIPMPVIYDNEIGRDNPVSNKYAKLEKSMLHTMDINIKPNVDEKRELDKLISMPKKKSDMTDQDKMLLYKFRYTLINNKQALVKFLYSIDWTNSIEAEDALKMMQRWERIDVEDALILLSKDFENEYIRQYAVNILQDVSDEDLDLYMLQLVNAIKWEKQFKNGTVDSEQLESPLANFLIKRAVDSDTLSIGNWLYWYLYACANQESIYQDAYSFVFSKYRDMMSTTAIGRTLYETTSRQIEFLTKIMSYGRRINEDGGRANKKLDKLKEIISKESSDLNLSTENPLPLPLRPELEVVGINQDACRVFKSARAPFLLEFTLNSKNKKSEKSVKELIPVCANKECNKIHMMCTCKNCANCGAAFTEPGHERHHCRLCNYAICTACCSSSIDIEYYCTNTQKCEARTTKTIKIMFKLGDDITQDQLVLQMIRLMDKLLKKMSLDMNLSIYRVLPMNHDEGLLEIVNGATGISKIKNVQEFLKESNYSEKAEYNISEDAMNRYVKSFAGYCVITYLLGIGDRHLDNIMVKKTGEFFHIDFGFILGRDPKWNPPAVRLTPEMVEGFGGPKSENFGKFINYCCQAYNILRKSANLIINLLRLMEDGGMDAINEASISKVQDKFNLNLNDEDAERIFLGILDTNLNAMWPGILEMAHKLATAAR